MVDEWQRWREYRCHQNKQDLNIHQSHQLSGGYNKHPDISILSVYWVYWGGKGNRWFWWHFEYIQSVIKIIILLFLFSIVTIINIIFKIINMMICNSTPPQAIAQEMETQHTWVSNKIRKLLFWWWSWWWCWLWWWLWSWWWYLQQPELHHSSLRTVPAE